MANAQAGFTQYAEDCMALPIELLIKEAFEQTHAIYLGEPSAEHLTRSTIATGVLLARTRKMKELLDEFQRRAP